MNATSTGGNTSWSERLGWWGVGLFLLSLWTGMVVCGVILLDLELACMLPVDARRWVSVAESAGLERVAARWKALADAWTALSRAAARGVVVFWSAASLVLAVGMILADLHRRLRICWFIVFLSAVQGGIGYWAGSVPECRYELDAGLLDLLSTVHWEIAVGPWIVAIAFAFVPGWMWFRDRKSRTEPSGGADEGVG